MPLTLTATKTDLSGTGPTDFSTLVPGIGGGSRSLYNIAGVLYYVTKRQVPFPNAPFGQPNDLVFYKSSNGINWTHVTQSVISDNENCATCSDGSKIFISDYSQFGPFHAKIWTFDPATGNLAGPSSDGPLEDFTDQVQTCSCNNAGDVVTVFTDPGGILKAVPYTPGSDSWGTVRTVNAGPAFPVAQISDPTLDHIFVYFYDNANRLFIATLAADGTLLNTSGSLVTFPGNPAQQTFGLPALITAGPTGNRSVLLPYKIGGPPTIKAAWIDVTDNTTTVQMVDDASTLPPGDQIQAYSQTAVPGWSALEFAGVPYILYTVDNGDLNDASSQSFLYARSFSGGVWGGSQILFTSGVPEEMVTPFASTLGTTPAVLIILFDPTIGTNDLATLSAWILLGSGAPPPPGSPSTTLFVTYNGGGANNAGGRGPVVLPDASVVCSLDGQKRCVMVDSPTVVKSKAQTMRFDQ